MRDFRFLVLLILNVLRQDQDRHAVAGLGDPDAAVDQVPHLRRRGRFLDEVRDVGKHAVEIDFLLVVAAAHRGFGLTANREHRRVVQLSVVEPCDQMGGTRAAGG